MCGIAGMVGPRADRERVARMNRALHHRGPDDQGVYAAEDVVLGHTRLAIIDLSPGGHQPMAFGDYVITFNGEIYNFKALKAALPGPFLTASDTEVILHLYARYGASCVDHLEGMFAFVIYDRRRQEVFAARDRLGMKPLYYTQHGDTLAFASELKALLLDGAPPMDRTALRDYFTYGYVPAPKSAYAGIAKLPAAHTLTFRAGVRRVARYWEPSAAIRYRDPAVAVEALDEILGRVIRAHTLADVPVGVFLSGGLDSATLTSYLERPTTFTLGFDVAARSEADAAARVARHFGTAHRSELAGAGDLAQALAVMPSLFDEPFADSAAWSNYLIARAARREVTVALSGEGGDELFCGYPRYWQYDGRRSRAARLLARVLPPLTGLGQSMERRAHDGLDGYAARFSQLTRPQLPALLGAPYSLPGYDDLWFYRQHWREDLGPIQRMRWLDLHTNLAEGLLTKVDRSSMAHSLEVRPPLLDHRLVEFALAVDPALWVDRGRGEGKGLLRRLMGPRLPAGHLSRPKSGFGLPVRRWIRANPALVAGASDRLQAAGVLRRPIPAGFRRTFALLSFDRWWSAAGAGP